HQFTLEAVSYTTDALGDLIRATLEVAAGGRMGTVSFDLEPTEWRLQLLAHAPHLTLTVHEFAAAVDAGRELFRAECDLDAFARAVLDAGAAVLKEVDPAGYLPWW